MNPLLESPVSESVSAITQGTSSLGHLPAGRWQFDESVTAVFDDMLARSIPHLDGMRDTVTQVAVRLAQPGSYIVDLGCSLGGAIAPLVERLAGDNKFIGLESSESMVRTCRERFKSAIDAGIVDIRCGDLRSGYPSVDASVTLCVLTLMFTPIEYRFGLLSSVCSHTRSGGGLILVEKVLGHDAYLASELNELYYERKRRLGYTQHEIEQKRRSLEGVLVPLTAAWNEEMLFQAGFPHVECVWRCLNFAAWLAIKG
jgi:tRNA (cmo5U34)-methyltransferase